MSILIHPSSPFPNHSKPIKFQSLKQTHQGNNNLNLAFDSFTHLGHHDYYSYGSILDLCAASAQRGLNQGKEIHALLVKCSHFVCDDVFLGTKLVFMYGKCGSVRDAEKVFDDMPVRSVFTWNAMIGAYVSNRRWKEAVELYCEARCDGVRLDEFTFPGVMKACGAIGDARRGAEVHGFVIKNGFDNVGFAVNAVVSMYCKCDDVASARKVFDRMLDREDVALWSSIISGCSAAGKPLEALSLFREMRSVDVDVSSFVLVAALGACEERSFKRSGMEIHASALKSGYVTSVYVANALVIMYSRCGSVEEAKKIFDRMIDKDIVSWNSIISGLVQNDHHTDACSYFREFQKRGQKPDSFTLMSVLTSCGRLESLMNGMEAHAVTIKNGLDDNLMVGNTLIDMYAKCRHVNYLERVFAKMPDKDPISWTTVIAGFTQNGYQVGALEVFREAQGNWIPVDAMMIGSVLQACTGIKSTTLAKEIHGYILKSELSDLVMSNTLVDVYGECGNIEYATRVFDRIPDKDVVSWTSMMSAYVDNKLPNESLNLYRIMQENGIELDSVAVMSLLTAAAALSALNKGKEIHGFLLRKGFALEGPIPSSLVDMYARCGSLEDSSKIFSGFVNKDVVLWTTMINAAGIHGQGDMAIEVFNEMESENVFPDHITFLALLYACSHSGLTDQGQRFLKLMRSKYQLEPWLEHYACMVDLLGRANRLKEAYEFVRNMPTGRNAAAWCSLLGACHVHGNKELGEIAAQELLSLNPENPGNYVLISNVFAATGRWKEVDQVRHRMRGKGLKKDPACSWIEVKNKVHTFMASDKSHPQSDEVYRKLDEVIEVLEKGGGYVARTKYVLHNIEEDEKTKRLHRHSERLAIAYGLLETSDGTPIRVMKNLRVCGDCHDFIKLISKFFDREIMVRDASRFHHFSHGTCSCGDFW